MNTTFVRFLAAAGLVLAGTAQAQTSVTLQQGLNSYAGATDTYLSSSAKTTNYGTATSLQDQTSKLGVLVRFNIFQSEGGPVPNGVTIQSATLSLYKSSGGATTYGARRLLKNWSETQATWNNRITGTVWSTAGATGSGTDILATADGTASTTTSAGWLNFTVTGGVAAFGSGTANDGWRLVPTSGSTAAKSFYSREYTSNTTLRPKLTVTYVPMVPGAPSIATATAGNAQAAVSFTAPASNGGSAITGYTVTSSPGGLTATGTASPITVTGLTNGIAYTFTAKATNAVGTGAASAASNSVTPATVPGAPTIGSATAGNASASVALTAPASNGGSAITAYTVTSSPGGLTGTGTVSPISVSGLANGTAYTFTVTATNAKGTSPASTPSNSVTPATVPGAPTIGTATAGNAQATVAFTASVSNGGSAITGYTVTSSPGGLTAAGTVSPIIVTGLTNGTAYTFTVTATNAVGTGVASGASNTVTPTAPLTDATTLYFVHPDHLGTPRLISDGLGNTVWTWDNTEPFGNSSPNENPSGTGPSFSFNLRFPGQYYDAETGLSYNFFRDYDPSTGRYVQSDPIGLKGGINTYAYVGGNPISRIDSDGRQIVVIVHNAKNDDGSYGGVFPPGTLPPSSDPWSGTTPIVTTPPNWSTQDPSDCDKQYSNDLEACRNTCGPVSISRYACFANAFFKLRACRRIHNIAGGNWTGW